MATRDEHSLTPDDDEKRIDPQHSGPERCSHCGSQRLGRRVEEEEQPLPCIDNVTDCTCCYCPDCGAKSIYHRESMSPDYRCINCKTEFDNPIGAYARDHEFFPRECLDCGNITRGP